MTDIVNSNLTATLAAAGFTAKNIMEFVPEVPADGLVAIWRGDVGVTEESGTISQWAGVPNQPAIQNTEAARPTLSGSNVVFDGSDDYLTTDVALNGDGGYIAVKIKMTSITSVKALGGAQSSLSKRAWFGIDSTKRAFFSIGSQSQTFRAATVLVVDTEYVLGFSWDDATGLAKIRIDGSELNSVTFNAGGQTVSPLAIDIGANNLAGSPANNINGEIIALAVFEGTPGTDFDVDAIDAAMAAF
ncbi:MAG: hypothetical protein VYD90_12890 [Pseudomonadota bacterium]|nr:hypothetical protein [Pseudomonadota bacterium]